MHYINEQNREERRKKLEIYILRQVNTLDKGFKLSYACKVFHCCWQMFYFTCNHGLSELLFAVHCGQTLTCEQRLNAAGDLQVI